MTRDVVTCSANESSAVAVKLLKTNKISGAPVVSNEGICLGVFSVKDLPRGEGQCENAVFCHMTSPAITVSEHHSLLDVAAILHSSRVHRVPVVDNRGHVLGIISTMDIVDEVINAMDAEAAGNAECVGAVPKQ